MVAIVSIGIANLLVLLRVLVLWQDDEVCPVQTPPEPLENVTRPSKLPEFSGEGTS